MNFLKNLTLLLCLFFLIGCMNFSSTSDLKNFDIDKVELDQNTYPVVVIGGGFGGLTSGMYLGQANIKNLVIKGRLAGGAITKSHSVCNWPGEKNIAGTKLAEKILDHSKHSGANLLEARVADVDFSVWPYLLKIKQDNQKPKIVKALSCIIATGAKSIFLDIPGEQKYFGRGVSKCATCDGPLYKNKVVAVVGGGNTAITDASYLSNIAKKVYIIVRRDKLRSTGKIVNEVISNSNVEVLYNTQVKEVFGNQDRVTGLKTYNSQTKKLNNLVVDGMFLAVGSIPKSNLFKNKLKMDNKGYIVVNRKQETSKPGVFAVGDVCEPEFKQLVIAGGQGAKAAMQTQRFLEKIGYNANKVEEDLKPEKSLSDSKNNKSNLGTVIEIKNLAQFNKEVKNYKGKLIVDFYAHWCYPCKMMMPVIKKLAAKFSDIKFIKADVSQIDDLAQLWQVQGVPTFVFLKNGQEVYRFSGGKSEDDLGTIIKEKF